MPIKIQVSILSYRYFPIDVDCETASNFEIKKQMIPAFSTIMLWSNFTGLRISATWNSENIDYLPAPDQR